MRRIASAISPRPNVFSAIIAILMGGVVGFAFCWATNLGTPSHRDSSYVLSTSALVTAAERGAVHSALLHRDFVKHKNVVTVHVVSRP